MRLILASTSPARLMLLRSAGIEPALIDPAVDEHAVTLAAETAAGAPLQPAALVQLLARAKAEAASAALLPNAAGLVLGGDSVFVLDGVIYGKPHTPEAALERWRLQRGRTGQLFSGHWLIDHSTDAAGRAGAAPRAVGAVAVAEVTFAGDITDAELHAYIATEEPLFVAGAFTIDSLGAPFIGRIVGDPSTVVGLSLPTLRRMVMELGYEWPSLWNRLAGDAVPPAVTSSL
ncbi:septum formation inhibitor Maf [Cryobacterium frigoriphilum]|uniref:Nucleoside triphosphate pyrophosphatase n=1 Tax=Cryobacterium frigoriphilum TaxID=1259150 RepID=A0A4R9A936_9MICO|nr:nucleoside triphosphate pyrophosphatase [Cryobacterium frigoriphilum]TFD54183.1 septum formation inhibitor Maf [Cryobacterium frigoriphilum]